MCSRVGFCSVGHWCRPGTKPLPFLCSAIFCTLGFHLQASSPLQDDFWGSFPLPLSLSLDHRGKDCPNAPSPPTDALLRLIWRGHMESLQGRLGTQVAFLAPTVCDRASHPGKEVGKDCRVSNRSCLPNLFRLLLSNSHLRSLFPKSLPTHINWLVIFFPGKGPMPSEVSSVYAAAAQVVTCMIPGLAHERCLLELCRTQPSLPAALWTISSSSYIDLLPHSSPSYCIFPNSLVSFIHLIDIY